jgi:hypothetical protein
MDDHVPDIQMFGYSDRDTEAVLRWALSSHRDRWLPGDYTVTARDTSNGTVRIVSAPIAAFPAYFTFDRSGDPVVGTDVFTVARAAGLSWDWNLDAIRSMALFGYTTGSETLHPDVYRIPEDRIMELSGGRVHSRSAGFWDGDPAPTTARSTRQAVRQAFISDVASKPVLLSLSSGYDSRYLLALCLAEGILPRVVTIGAAESTDAQVASEITRRYGLPHECLALRPEEYLSFGQTISRVTSGTKTAKNWHTFLYSRQAGAVSKDEVHLVGSMGEFARSHFFYPLTGGRPARVADAGSVLASHLPARFAQGHWLARLQRRSRKFAGLSLVSRAGTRDLLRMAHEAAIPAADMATSLDQFYARRLVRHLVGNGLALYSVYTRPRSPFLHASVVQAVRGLPRSAKVNEMFPSEAIRELAPGLLDLPFNTPLCGERVSYSVFGRVRRLPDAREIILETQGLDSLISKREREALVESGSEEVFELLLTLAFAAVNSVSHTTEVI